MLTATLMLKLQETQGSTSLQFGTWCVISSEVTRRRAFSKERESLRVRSNDCALTMSRIWCERTPTKPAWTQTVLWFCCWVHVKPAGEGKQHRHLEKERFECLLSAAIFEQANYRVRMKHVITSMINWFCSNNDCTSHFSGLLPQTTNSQSQNGTPVSLPRMIFVFCLCREPRNCSQKIVSKWHVETFLGALSFLSKVACWHEGLLWERTTGMDGCQQ